MKTHINIVLVVVSALLLVIAPHSGVVAQDKNLSDPVAQEIIRLEAAAANIPGNYVNPPNANETFSHLPILGEGELWQYLTINGAGQNIVNQTSAFHNSSAQVVNGNRKGLMLSQVFDPDFAAEQPNRLYNNVYLVGFAGYIPTDDQITIKFKMRVEPGFYGTTGVFLEPQDTFDSNGNFQIPADWFGVSYAGEENYNAGLKCNYIIAWTPLVMQTIRTDPSQWNEYKITLSMIDQAHMEATMEVNGEAVCSQSMPRFPIELQVWSDNYKVTTDGNSINIGFNNKVTPQAVLYDAISVKTR